jgi:hypothetical protein
MGLTALDIVGILSSKEFIAIYVAAAGVAVSTVTYWYQKKEFRLKSLTEALSRLNDVKHKEARKVVYGNATPTSFEILGFSKPTPEGGASPNDLMTLSKDMVRSDFNEVATLIYHKLLDKKIFLREYCWIIIRIWRLLEHDILDRRRAIGPSDYMKNFEDLKKMALDYVSKNHPEYLKYPSMCGGQTTSQAPSRSLIPPSIISDKNSKALGGPLAKVLSNAKPS